MSGLITFQIDKGKPLDRDCTASIGIQDIVNATGVHRRGSTKAIILRGCKYVHTPGRMYSYDKQGVIEILLR